MQASCLLDRPADLYVGHPQSTRQPPDGVIGDQNYRSLSKNVPMLKDTAGVQFMWEPDNVSPKTKLCLFHCI